MNYPPLLKYDESHKYRCHYENMYCKKPIQTFDGIMVYFRKHQFNHCFFESSQRNKIKDQFSYKRAERVEWIKVALQDPNAERFVGWDSAKKCEVKRRRVTVVMKNYVVVIRLQGNSKASFMTAYVADKMSIDKIRSHTRLH